MNAKTEDIVDGDESRECIGKRTLGVALADHHQRRRRGCFDRDRPEQKCNLPGLSGQQKTARDQARRKRGFDQSQAGYSASEVPNPGELKHGADGEEDESESDFAEDIQHLQILVCNPAEARWTDDDANKNVARHFRNPRYFHQVSGKQSQQQDKAH